MTAAQIQTLIDTNLATGSSITALKHREVESALLNFMKDLATSFPLNVGSVTVGDIGVGSVGFIYLTSGNVVSAVLSARTKQGNVILVTIPNAYSGDYKVDTTIESLGTLELDNDIHPMVFKKNNSNSFFLYIEDSPGFQNIKIHFETKSI